MREITSHDGRLIPVDPPLLADDPWGSDCRYCESDKGTPFVLCAHEGGHKFTPERVPSIVEFFRTCGPPRSGP